MCDETMKNNQMYMPCFDTNTGNHDILHSLLRDYVINKRYNTLFGDLIPFIAAKSIGVNIFVITERDTGYYVHSVKNVHGATKNVMILKNGHHYDAILKIDNTSVNPSEHTIRPMDCVVNAPNQLDDMSSSLRSDQAETKRIEDLLLEYKKYHRRETKSLHNRRISQKAWYNSDKWNLVWSQRQFHIRRIHILQLSPFKQKSQG